MAGKARKNKTVRRLKSRPGRPALPVMDRVLYGVALAAAFALIFGLAVIQKRTQDAIALRDPEVIAYTASGTQYLMLPLVFYLIVSAGVLFAVRLSNRIPIRDWRVRPCDRQLYRFLAACWCAVLVLLTVLAGFSLCGRDCLRRDQSVVHFNALNQETGVYTQEDFRSMRVRLYHAHYRGSVHAWRVTITMADGKHLTLDKRGFQGADGMDTSLEIMTEFRSMLDPERITVVNGAQADAMADCMGMSSSQRRELLYLAGQ